jgi:hypothetical protein
MVDSHFILELPLPKKRGRWQKTAGLTRAEAELLEVLGKAIEKYGNPSLKEIASCYPNGAGYASMVQVYLRRLRDKGYVELPEARRSRGIKLLNKDDSHASE